eukprot:gnl/TRDRNA2_/TRDRNA2_85553_c0_seq1.p1 gnl/TRDRNA2_/TRDRNA2_85553_c0~~gnl/TRDRNA2_/TRDRNA2_85553_c0_seq1.p1  ORF type:complete len:271 (+),score=72.65 gnl/TRDRNA2_/TRDRNA2_85553_c0_seq1:41-814(+)
MREVLLVAATASLLLGHVAPVAAKKKGDDDLAGRGWGAPKKKAATGTEEEMLKKQKEHKAAEDMIAENDKVSAEHAKLVRCDVCSTVLESTLASAASFDEDGIADALEGKRDKPLEKTGDAALDAARATEVGCGKHFKDMVRTGWGLNACEGTEDTPCLSFVGPPAEPEKEAGAYAPWKQTLYFACQQSIGTHMDGLVEFLPGALKKNPDTKQVAKVACEKIAKCGEETARKKKKTDAKTEEKKKEKKKAKKSHTEL